MPSVDWKLSDIGTKEGFLWFLLNYTISLRFPLKDFFIGVLQKLGIAPCQLTTNSWKIMTALYVGCYEKNREAILDLETFFHCYYLQAGWLLGQYYLCPCKKSYCFIENVNNNLKDRNVIFKVHVLEAVSFSRKWRNLEGHVFPPKSQRRLKRITLPAWYTTSKKWCCRWQHRFRPQSDESVFKKQGSRHRSWYLSR